jgi:hypothetical protein
VIDPAARGWTSIDGFVRLDRRIGLYLVAAAAANGLLSIGGRIGWDFHAYWLAAGSVASGGGAYGATLALGVDRWGSEQTYVYPPLLAHVLALFRGLPEEFVFAAFALVGVLAVCGALRSVERGFHGSGLVPEPAFARLPRLIPAMGVLWITLLVGQINLLVLAGLLLALGHRSDPAAGVGLALAVLLRGTPAVFALILLFDRRWRALAWAALATSAGLLVGMADLPTWIDVTRTLATLAPVHSIWQTSLAVIHPAVAVVAAVLVAAVVIAAGRVPAEARLIRGTALGAGLLLVPGSAWFHWASFAAAPLLLEGHATAWSRRALGGLVVAGLLIVPLGSWATSLAAASALVAIVIRVAAPRPAASRTAAVVA